MEVQVGELEERAKAIVQQRQQKRAVAEEQREQRERAARALGQEFVEFAKAHGKEPVLLKRHGGSDVKAWVLKPFVSGIPAWDMPDELGLAVGVDGSLYTFGGGFQIARESPWSDLAKVQELFTNAAADILEGRSPHP